MFQYSLIENDGEANIVVFIPGQNPRAANESHPYFDAIVQGARSGDPDVIDLFDLADAVAKRFEPLSERVSVKDGAVYIDGDEADSAITRQILRFIEQGLPDWQPLVNFVENVLANPNEHSQTQLYAWLAASDGFTIDEEGCIIGYKGVSGESGGTFRSINSGRAVVNGEEQSGRIAQTVGDVVEMPRSEVQHDPATGCHTGLHVGTWDYASGFARGALLLVKVNPRDVVSVPTDCGAQKMRTCRYEVVGVVPQNVTAPIASALYDQDDEDLWGDGEGFEDDFAF
jgi:hypothetical protein